MHKFELMADKEEQIQIKIENLDDNDADPQSVQHKADGHGESEDGSKPLTTTSKGSKWISALKREE